VFFARVVDNSDGSSTQLPASEFTIMREAFKSNKSNYFVNGKVSSFTEVTTLLRDYGVDLDNNRFLILQGEVELIASMPPKAKDGAGEGMLEYLEEIAGSNKFVEPIKLAEKIVEQLGEQRLEKHKRCKVHQRVVMPTVVMVLCLTVLLVVCLHSSRKRT
jgi:structural maintenance of chromosome 4